jgi:hypothetical protein
MNAKDLEDYVESLNRSSLVKLFTLLWRQRQQSLIDNSAFGSQCSFWIQTRMGFMRKVTNLEIRNGHPAGWWHTTVRDGEKVDEWYWYGPSPRAVTYVAQAIEEDSKYYYQVGEQIIEITNIEYNRVTKNPNLYYLSTALNLHYRMELENKGTRLQDLPRKERERDIGQYVSATSKTCGGKSGTFATKRSTRLTPGWN